VKAKDRDRQSVTVKNRVRYFKDQDLTSVINIFTVQSKHHLTSISPFVQAVYGRRAPYFSRGRSPPIRSSRAQSASPEAARQSETRLIKTISPPVTDPRAKVVPCHRIVRSDLKLGGFNGGSRAKERLCERSGWPSPEAGLNADR